ncbi:hypothetical protein Cgig2_011546 [Carnegiea gigantea]|uniref:Uncharacterized protein n=1 Tax=Carnegiea gigantea TaxID=171969 RepID=A0A9Q1GLC9_9CARY|nr:hypothetical protein Cgig2_011546 [Carnegiea gigantea]
MAYYSSSSSTHHARSASYPPKTNPLILKIEQQLKKLQESEASSSSPMQTISIGLTGLAGLYKCVDDALNYLPLLPKHNAKSHVEQLVNGSLKLLQVCTSSMAVVMKLRETVGERRLSNEKLPEVSRYFFTRKEIMKSTKVLDLSLRLVVGELISENRELSQQESELTRAFRCVSIINITVMESLLQLLSSKPTKSTRFHLISKILVGRSKEAEDSAAKKRNELSNVDIALCSVFSRDEADGQKVVIAQKRLEELEEGLRGIENGLSCISSKLAKARASLLNIVSLSSSYPPKTNPVILKIDQQLKKLRELESSSTSRMQSISIGLTGLAGLYKCVDDALNYFPHHNNAKTHAKQLMNGSLRLLEVCDASREMLGRLREAVWKLRRSFDEKLLEVPRYFSTRKEILRSARGLALSLRQVEGELISDNRELIQEESELTRAFRCVSIINISVMESLLQLLSSKLPRSTRFSLFSKVLMRRSKETGELSEGKGNELSNVDTFLHSVFSKEKGSAEKTAIAQKRLQELEEALRGMEIGLSSISSQLAKTRASCLKIVVATECIGYDYLLGYTSILLRFVYTTKILRLRSNYISYLLCSPTLVIAIIYITIKLYVNGQQAQTIKITSRVLAS